MYRTRVAAKRPGQIRFEAWIPQPLAEAFNARIPNKTAWLRAAMTQALGDTAPPPEPPHRHRRTQTGTRTSAGTTIPIYKCKDCGVTLNA